MLAFFTIRRIVLLTALVAAGVSLSILYLKHRAKAEEEAKLPHVTLDFRFTAPEGYLICGGDLNRRPDEPSPHRFPHKNLLLQLGLPARIEAPQGEPHPTPIVFHTGRTDVDVYKHLDSGRLIATHGTIHMDGGQPVLKVELNMADWPPGRYVVGIAGDPLFAYCTVDFVD